MSHYPVYLIESLGAPRNHHAIFVQTNEDKTGSLFNVTGNIQSGMEFEAKESREKPELSQTFLSKSQLGWIKADDLHRFEEICRANPPPAKQFDGPERIDKTKPLRRCQEWTSETVASLRAEGILHIVSMRTKAVALEITRSDEFLSRYAITLGGSSIMDMSLEFSAHVKRKK